MAYNYSKLDENGSPTWEEPTYDTDKVGGVVPISYLQSIGINSPYHMQATGFRDNGDGTATRTALLEDPTANIENSKGLSPLIGKAIVGATLAGFGSGGMSLMGGAGAGAGSGGQLLSGMDIAGDSLAASTPLSSAAPVAADASWGVNPQFNAPMSTPGSSFVDPNTLQTVTGGPMSTTGSLMAPSGASYLPGASQALPIGSAPFDWTKTPTTGNKAVDQLISKAATTALQSGLATGAGAANQLTAGTGGDTTGADQQAADEARKQSLIGQINQMYAPENFTGEEGDLSNAIRGQQGDALKLGYDNAARATTFDAARRGNVGGSVMADNIAGLNRDNQLGSTKIEDAVNSALAGLRSSRLASQGNAISLVNAGSGPEGVNAAATGIKNAIDTARAEKVPDVTQGLFQNVALSNQGINTGNSIAQQNAYINARTGGGSLFSLGSGASGRNVNVN